MCPVPGDSSLYLKRSPGSLERMTGTYVDDCLNTRTSEIDEFIEQIFPLNLDSTPRVYDEFDFYGSQVAIIAKETFLLSWKYYASKKN